MENDSHKLKVIIEELKTLKDAVLALNQENKPLGIKLKDEVWTVNQVAKYLHKSKGTIQSHYQGKVGFPRSKRIGNTHYWKPLEIIAYAQTKTIH